MNYSDAKAIKQDAENAVKAAGTKVRQYPRLDNGLVSDKVRKSAEYQADKAAYENAHARFARVNKWFVANFKKEYLAERKASRMAS